LIHEPLISGGATLPETGVFVERTKLARRFWRAVAQDGTEFGVEVDVPLKHGDVIWADGKSRYVIHQLPEPLLEVPLDVAPDAAAVIGWAAGNLHIPIDAQSTRLLAPDGPAIRQLLDRLGIHYRGLTERFRPHRLAGSLAGHGQMHDAGHLH
jgi:urease accessory protein